MKKTAILLIFMLIASVPVQAEVSKWEKYGSFTEVDIANIQPAGNDTYNYRFKINNTGTGLFKPLETGFNKRVAYTINQENINCKTRIIKTSTIETYGIDGKIINKQNMLASPYSEHEVKKGGGYDKLYNMICK